MSDRSELPLLQPAGELGDWLFEIEQVLEENEDYQGMAEVELALQEHLLPTWQAERPDDARFPRFLATLTTCNLEVEPEGEVWSNMQEAGAEVAALLDDEQASAPLRAIAECVSAFLEGGPAEFADRAAEVTEIAGSDQGLAERVQARLSALLERSPPE